MSQSTHDAARTSVESGGIEELSEDEQYELLSSATRRLAIGVLAEGSAPIDVGELAAAIARRESGADAPDPEAVERAEIGLHHNHLPRMDALGLVEYDREASRVVASHVPVALARE